LQQLTLIIDYEGAEPGLPWGDVIKTILNTQGQTLKSLELQTMVSSMPCLCAPGALDFSDFIALKSLDINWHPAHWSVSEIYDKLFSGPTVREVTWRWHEGHPSPDETSVKILIEVLQTPSLNKKLLRRFHFKAQTSQKITTSEKEALKKALVDAAIVNGIEMTVDIAYYWLM
jgi:hypothetical protein